MALVTCPTCGSLTIGARQTCQACQRSATDEHRLTGLEGQDLTMRHTHMSATSSASTTSTPDSAAIPAARQRTIDGSTPSQSASADDGQPTPNAVARADEDASTISGAMSSAGSREPPDERHATLVGGRRGGPQRALFGMGVLVILLISVALLTGPARSTTPTVIPTRAVATHTPLPTATATGTPLPTALPGYKVFADTNNAFVIQYPTAWQATHNDAGVAISDNSSPEDYTLQVFHEDSSTCSNADAKTAAACWVDFYLSQLSSREALQNVQRLTGPTPAVTFGGQLWQTGVATFVLANAPNRIQVFATVYQGQPYLIAVLAPDGQFATANDLFFKPMLATFAFLSSDVS